MKKLLLPIVLIMFAVMPFTAQADMHGDKDKMSMETHKPAIYAVLFYADWCGSCQVLDPAVEEARASGKLDEKDVLFVTLDLTDDTTKNQSALMANALGMGEFYEANNGKTGYLLLMNAKTGEEMARIKKDMNAEQIAEKISGKLDMIKG